MKNIKTNQFYIALLLSLVLLINIGCERELSDEATPSTFAPTGEIFLDNFVAMGENFYLPFADSKLDAFSVDRRQGFESNASYRIDVPNNNDPTGNYAGAILRVDGAGRDLSGFTALTFYAKASRGVTIDQIGFGQDFLENKYQVSASNVSLGTNWQKYYIPIPDPSFLVNERGVFWYAAGTQGTGGSGYIVWFDEIKFEDLRTIAQPRPEIFNGNDITVETFNGVTIPVTGLTQTLNLPNGLNQTVAAAPSYFQFTSSNPSVASVNAAGQISINSEGTAVITATLGGVQANGSITVNSSGDFVAAPTPTRNQANVISVFSDAYTNVPVDYYNGFFAPFQTTLGGAPPLNIAGDQIIQYTNLNFVGIGTFLDVSPLNLDSMSHIHVDINVQESVDPGDFIRLQILNGVQTDNEISGSFTISSSELSENNWASFDIPLSSFSGLNTRNQVGLLFFISDATISNIFVDNIYYYNE